MVDVFGWGIGLMPLTSTVYQALGTVPQPDLPLQHPSKRFVQAIFSGQINIMPLIRSYDWLRYAVSCVVFIRFKLRPLHMVPCYSPDFGYSGAGSVADTDAGRFNYQLTTANPRHSNALRVLSRPRWLS